MMKEFNYISALKAYLGIFLKDGQYNINHNHPSYAFFAPKIGMALDGLALNQPEKFNDNHKNITMYLVKHKKIGS